ncbi:MAG: hypothetical protein M0C28_47050 [Candidatus Moduliflexus flocculans]|nr:hypothetical protein [Candidatus Moduliflexus flocculans]
MRIRPANPQLPGKAGGRLRLLLAALWPCCLVPTAAADGPRIVLGGDAGRAAAACAQRFLGDPFNSLPWLRADLIRRKGHRVRRRLGPHPAPAVQELLRRHLGPLHRDHGPGFAWRLGRASGPQRPAGAVCRSSSGPAAISAPPASSTGSSPIDVRPEGGMDG